MKYVSALIFCLVLASCSNEQAPAQTPVQNNEAIFVLIENSGTIAADDQDNALDVVLHLLQQLTKLARRKATKDAQIHILMTALPNQIAWSGTPDQLLKEAGDVKDLLTFKNSFSDLVIAFEQIDTTINLTQPSKVRLYWIGSTIHVPFQTTDKNSPIEVKVPQEVPANLALASFADRLSVLKIMRVHPDQDQMLQAYLGGAGILNRAKLGKIDFALQGAAQTQSRINDLL